MIRRAKVRRRRRSPVFAAWLAVTKGPCCARWRNFPAFYADIGPRPSWAHLVVRSDTSRPFEPGNAGWQVAKWHRSPRAMRARPR